MPQLATQGTEPAAAAQQYQPAPRRRRDGDGRGGEVGDHITLVTGDVVGQGVPEDPVEAVGLVRTEFVRCSAADPIRRILDVRGAGVLGEYMDAALADALGIKLDELEELKEEGFNLREYAEENEISPEELAELMVEVQTNAINAALADGAITQEQAEHMLSMVENHGSRIPMMPGP